MSFLIAFIYLVAIVAAVDAVYLARSPQGAAAWATFIVSFPYLGIPAYLIFGRHRFREYRDVIRKFVASNENQAEFIRAQFRRHVAAHPPIDPVTERVFETLARSEFTEKNELELLIDGEATFRALFEAMRRAKRYILAQFYLLRDDEVGREFGEHLMERARSGVKVYLLFDEIGSNKLGNTFVQELRGSGVEVFPFSTRRGYTDLFRINFRNHRKIVVIDGEVGFVGGVNIGDEYMGRVASLSPWRDTFLKLRGPGVLPLQASFYTDWIWATQSALDLEWNSAPREGDKHLLILRSGPADELERCLLLFVEAIQSAKERIWIASPYFVPDPSIITALQLAALRGVDVRVLLPRKPDHVLVWWASFTYLAEIIPFGVRVFHYGRGFLHEKAFVIDDDVCAIGTANLDNRSCRLNFEVMAIVADAGFTAEVRAMFERDFADSTEVTASSLERLPVKIRVLSRFARLFAPVL